MIPSRELARFFVVNFEDMTGLALIIKMIALEDNLLFIHIYGFTGEVTAGR